MHSKGLLFGPSTDDVIRFYHVAGMDVSPEFLELPDHIVQLRVPDARAALADLASAFYGHPAKDTATTRRGKGRVSASAMIRW